MPRLVLDEPERKPRLVPDEGVPGDWVAPLQKAISPITKAFRFGGKGLWKGLGYAFVPFERAERAMATPLTEMARARAKRMPPVAPGTELSFAEKTKRLLAGAQDPLAEWKETWPGIKAGAKALVPWPGMAPTEKTADFADLMGALKEIESGYEPSETYKNVYGTMLSIGATPKAVGAGLRGIGKLARFTRIPQKIGKARIPAWQIAKLKTRAELGARVERATELGKTVSGREAKRLAKELTRQTGQKVTPKAVKLRVGQLIKGGITTRPELAAKANPVIEEFENTYKTLRKLGLLGEETFLTTLSKKRIAALTKQKAGIQKQLTRLKTAPHYVGTTEISAKFPGRAIQIQKLQSTLDNITDKIQASYKVGGEKYLPRMYRSKEEERLARKFMGWSKHRIRQHYAKKREQIPFEVRKMMGEIKEPAYPVMKRLIQEGADIEHAKLFNFVAQHKDWVDDVWRPGLAKKALPTTKAYGTLAGKYVAPRIHSDLTELMHIRNNFEKTYDTLIGSWKLGKVVLNPATHFRNKISNKILLDLSGMGFAEQTKYALRVLKEYKANSKEYQLAKRYFARTTQVRGEILDDILRTSTQAQGTGFDRVVNSIRMVAKKVAAKPAAMYQHEEFVNKFMKYLQQRDKGKSVIQSVLEANKWLFDYGDLAQWEIKYMRRLMPFYTFPRKAIPRVLEAAANRPLTLAKYPLIAKMTTQYSLAKLNLTDKDYEDIQKVLPDYMKRGSYILMPYRDDNGDLRFFDWTYIIPWGALHDAEERGVLKTVVTNPLYSLVTAAMVNKDLWSGREVWKETDTFSERSFKKMRYVWENLSPSLAYKGIYWDKLEQAATGKPSKYGKVRPLLETVAHTIFGLRTQAVDVVKQKRFRMYEKQRQIKELRSKFIDISQRYKSGNIDRKRYEEKRKQYFKQMREIIRE